MTDRLLADAVLLLHGSFIAFVLFGGLLTLWRSGWIWLHLPAAMWGVLVMWTGWICPLTHLENHFRVRAGDAGYPGGFIEHHLLAMIYPEGLTRTIQMAIGALVLLLNLMVYIRWYRVQKRGLQASTTAP